MRIVLGMGNLFKIKGVCRMKQYFFEDINIGKSESLSRHVSATLVKAFAEVSGDNNPLHLNFEYAAASRFGEPIAQGVLLSSFISVVLGTQMPGLGTIYVSQSITFKAPVKFGDTVVTTVTAASKDTNKNWVTFITNCFVGDKKVAAGEAIVYVPSRPNGQKQPE